METATISITIKNVPQDELKAFFMDVKKTMFKATGEAWEPSDTMVLDFNTFAEYKIEAFYAIVANAMTIHNIETAVTPIKE